MQFQARAQRLQGLQRFSARRFPRRLGGLLWPMILLCANAATIWPQQAGVVPTSPLPASDVARFELGIDTADIRTNCIGQQDCPIPSFGIGAGATLNLTPHLALDSAVNVTPASSKGETNQWGGHASEFLIGPRAEIRARHYGYFVEAQPGLFCWSDAITRVGRTPTSFNFQLGSKTRFATLAGAGFEYSPDQRIHVRGGVSDLLIRYSNSSWTNNFQPSIGVYYSLGKTIPYAPIAGRNRHWHSFFDTENDTLIAASILGMTADSVTTQRFLKEGLQEGDPIARPLAKYGWSGQISLEALESGAEILGMYGLHRIGHHRLERAIPACIASIHAYFAYDNAGASSSAQPAP